MSFLEIIGKAKTYLHEHSRVSLRALRREFDLDDEALEELVEELVDIQRVARRNGKALEWAGPAEPASASRSLAATTLTPSPLTPNPLSSEAERRQLTVLFCDLVDSTRLAAGLDPEDWREVIRAWQESCRAVVERFAGHVARYLGDGLLVYFGWPHAHEDDAERALRAGLGIVEAMTELNARLQGEKRPTLAVRIGVHTGPVVAGELGDEIQVLGHTMNLAARLQAEAQPNTVLTSDDTLRLVRGIFVREELGARRLKGISEPVALYRVVQPAGVRGRLDLSRGRWTRFVGREQELGLLVERWEQAVEGEGQTVFLTGEAGLGKSRLALMLRERVGVQPHTWLECRSSPYTQGSAFSPVLELVEQGLQMAKGEPAAEQLRKLETGVELAGLDRATVVPLMAALLGIALGDAYPALQLSPELQRARTLESLVSWALALAEIQPLLLLVEDLHWCDPSSLELLGRLNEQLPTSRTLMVLTARPEFAVPWAHPKRWTPIALGRLRQRVARELVLAVVGERTLPAAAVSEILERADGVPLYLEELTRAALESEAAGAAVTIPATLQDSLMARLDRLSAAKEVAQLASVLGREFPYGLLASVAHLEETALRQSLGRLVEADLLFQRGTPPEASYTFKHALVQEAAYGSLLKRRREELHARAARALEERFPERAAAEPEVVARHYRAGGLPDAAAHYFEQAARRAVHTSSYEEAVGHLRQAVALLAQFPEGEERAARELAIQTMLGASLAHVRGYGSEETQAVFERARALLGSVSDPDWLAETLGGIFSVEQARGPLRAAAATAHRLSVLEGGSWVNHFVGEYEMGIADYYLGSPRLAAERLESAATALAGAGEELLERFGEDVGATAQSYLGWALWLLGAVDRAIVATEASIARARANGSLPSLAFALVLGGHLHKMRRDRERALALATEAIEISERHGYPLWLGAARLLTGWCAIGQPTALAQITEGIATAGSTGSQAAVTGILSILAEAQRGAGQPEQALATLDGALGLSAQFEMAFWDAELHRLKGELFLEMDGHTPAEAESEYQCALEIARRQEAKSLELRAATSLARLWRDQGKRAAARALLQPIYSWFTEGFDTLDLIEAKALLKELG
jgi:class 3 adenylate cyclase/predicted ATPase